ncbi:unnamed protein product [Tilletia controversa]|nr:unnamed protein product [Tilletia controversa]
MLSSAVASSSRSTAAALVRASASSRTTLAPASAAPVSAAAITRRYASGGSSYNQPTGHLFGEKPAPKGQKRQKEDWEDIWMYGMFGGMAFALVVLMYRPDTTYRLAESGEIWQYKPSPNSGYPEGVAEK